MQTSWDKLLQQTQLDDNLKMLAQRNIMVALPHLGLLKVSGVDAEKFLQGQLSCDVTQIAEQQSVLGSYCNPQGRLIAIFNLIKKADEYYLSMPLEIVSTTLTVLQKYSVFSKVELMDVSDAWCAVGIAGSKAAPQENCLAIAVSHERFILYTQTKNLENLWQTLQQKATPTINVAWQLLDIQAGLASIVAATQEKFLPHRLNLHLTKAINLEKGCFVGQEIIARMHYRGKLKHHLYRVELTAEKDIKLTPGMSLYDENEREVAQLVNYVMTAPQQYVALVIMQEKDQAITQVWNNKNSTANLIKIAVINT